MRSYTFTLDNKTYTSCDLTEDFEFTITPTMIERASCGDPEKCVVAQGLIAAVRKRFSGMVKLTGIQIGNWGAHICLDNGKAFRGILTKNLRHAIKLFDRAGEGNRLWVLDPGTYVLKAPRSSAKLGARPANSSQSRKWGQRGVPGAPTGGRNMLRRKVLNPATRSIVRLQACGL
jgi:hypothetical protein